MIRYRYRRHHGWTGALILLVALLLQQAAQHDWVGGIDAKLPIDQPGFYRVSRFVDGDTIEVSMNGHNEKVRLIGVDTPETHKPNTPVQCYGPAAAAYTKNTIGQQPVRLQADPLSTDRDRYQRLLRYVYLPDGRLLNRQLIGEGYGFYYPYFPFTKATEFERSQQTAMAGHKGLWANCQPSPTDGGGYLSNPI